MQNGENNFPEHDNSDRQRLHLLLERMVLEQRNRTTERRDLELEEGVSAFEGEDELQGYRRERRKLKKEIRLLREKAAFESEVSSLAREGLIISEEENYQFRLRLAALRAGRTSPDGGKSIESTEKEETEARTLPKFEDSNSEVAALKS